MKILVVSGFLGAGKTTFIKELIRRSGVSPIVFENEYGESDLDSQDLSSSAPGDMQILEFMEGCVCCTKKDSFANSILAISNSLDPEYLVVEPSGVGKLSNIIRNIQKVSYERIKLLRTIAVLSPEHYGVNLSEWQDIYLDQVKNADIIVYSKCENTSPEIISAVTERIRGVNPDAEIVSEHYTKKDDGWFKNIFLKEEDEDLLRGKAASDDGASSLSLEQVTLHHAHLYNTGELAVLLEDIIRGGFGRIARAKGTIPVGKEILRFDIADGLYMIGKAPDNSDNQSVFIGLDIDRQHLCDRLHTGMVKEKMVKTILPVYSSDMPYTAL